MDKQNLQKYINKKVYLVLKSGFKYKFVLKEEYIINESLSFSKISHANKCSCNSQDKYY